MATIFYTNTTGTARVIYHKDGLGSKYTVQHCFANGNYRFHTCCDSALQAVKLAENITTYIYPEIDLTIRGRTYAERKECLRQIAIDWEWYQHPWSYSELANWNDFFRTNGKRYGLLQEFTENGII